MHHISIFVPSLGGGGAERVMADLANELARRGHRVDLVLNKVSGPYLAEVNQDVRIVDLNRKRVIASLIPLSAYLRRERPDAMISVLTHSNIVAIMARAIARVKTRLVVSERSILPRFGKDWTQSVMNVLMKVFYPHADSIVAVSKGIAADLVEMLSPKARVVAIPNPVDIEAITRHSAERPDHPWFAAGDAPVLVAAGRLTEAKDYPNLIAAVGILRHDRPVRLVILGEGELRAELENRIAEAGLQDCVELVGFQKNPFKWMAAASVYVMSSKFEGFPNSLIQAMASGVPVVSTDCRTGPSEILEGGRWGRLVPVGDPPALATAIRATLDDPSPPDTRTRAGQFEPHEILGRYGRELTSGLGNYATG